LACRDPLFLHPPVVKVQVKAKPNTKISPDEIRQLSGIVDRASERGIFVGTGGFTKTAILEAQQMGIPLWDLDQLVTLVLDTYDSLGEKIQELVPLKQIWVLNDSDVGEDS
jgi:restriction system protein